MKSSIWRNTSNEWLFEFLKNNEISAFSASKIEPGTKFISFSFDADSGGMDVFGDTRIEFDFNLIFKQDAIEIIYEEEFFDEYPNISKHVCGYFSKEDYYKDKDLEGDLDAFDSQELTWETYISDFEHEREIVLKQLKNVPGLIKSIYFFEEQPTQKLRNLISQQNIQFTTTDKTQLEIPFENKKETKYVLLFEEFRNHYQYSDFGRKYLWKFLKDHPECDEDDFLDFLAKHYPNKIDLDTGEILDISQEEIIGFAKEYERVCGVRRVLI